MSFSVINIRTAIAGFIASVALLLSSAAYSQATMESTQLSFKYIASTLQTFDNTGRLSNNPGIDGADLEHYIALLRDYYGQFSSGFSPNSAMCQFYMDPENSRMTIEEKADLAFEYLRNLDDRVDRYMQVDEAFAEELNDQFGRILLDNITEAKKTAISNQRLPTSEYDEAAKINFADTACG